MKLALIKKLSPAIDKAKLVLNKKSPEIWLSAGVVCIVGGTIWACKASRKLDEVMDEHDKKIDYLDWQVEQDKKDDEDFGEKSDDPNDYRITHAEYHKQKVIVKLQTVGELTRMYAPAVILIGGGIGMVVNGHHILNKRNAALLSAYVSLEDSFTKYRGRVSERFGGDVEQELYSGKSYETVTVTEIDENGKKKKTKQQVPVIADGVSPYLAFYDKVSSKEWTTSPTFNHSFLLAQQNAANDLFMVRTAKMQRQGKRGWLFLNEVREMLGMDPTPTGAICGWISPLEGEIPEGDNYVDFGMTEDSENGTIILDFNCEGMIYDKI